MIFSFLPFFSQGPTSCEFVAELHDFVTNDVKRLYGDLVPHVKVTLVEAGPNLLGPFAQSLQQFTLRLFKNRDVDIRLDSAVTSIESYEDEKFRFTPKRAVLSDGTKLPFGTLVWSAGLRPVNFTDSLDGILPKANNGRILVDEYLRVKGHEGNIWAMGDAAGNEQNPLPQLAQVARQQGLYLADVFNGRQKEDEKPFEFINLGSMASLGNMTGLYDGSKVGKKGSEIDLPGYSGFLAYVSIKNIS